MGDVLVLGNGISRLLHEDGFIRSWTGEMWGANYIFRTHGARLTRLTGHANVLVEAAEHRAQHGHSYRIMGRIGNETSAEAPLLVPGELRKDSGTVLVAQAHEEGFETIYVCGYDLGGPDILSPNLHLQHKAQWVRRWRDVLNRYGRGRVAFVGHDHMPYLTGRESDDAYQKRYLAGLPHLPDPDYIALHRLIFGHVAGWRSEKIVKVRWLVKKPGMVSDMSEAVALKMVDKGQVEIIGGNKPTEQERRVSVDTKITTRMSVGTLREVARLRGVEGAEKMKKTELLELLR